MGIQKDCDEIGKEYNPEIYFSWKCNMASLESEETEIKAQEVNPSEENGLSDTKAEISLETKRELMTLYVETGNQVLIAMKGNRRIVVVNIP